MLCFFRHFVLEISTNLAESENRPGFVSDCEAVPFIDEDVLIRAFVHCVLEITTDFAPSENRPGLSRIASTIYR